MTIQEEYAVKEREYNQYKVDKGVYDSNISRLIKSLEDKMDAVLLILEKNKDLDIAQELKAKLPQFIGDSHKKQDVLEFAKKFQDYINLVEKKGREVLQ